MLKQIFAFTKAPTKERAAGGAPALLCIVQVLCAGLLAGCAASLNDSGGSWGAVGGASKAGQDSGAFASATTEGNSAYKVGPLDVLDITVFQVPELSKSVQVADTGTINLPLVGEVPASGKTAQQIERDLTKKLGAKYLHNPQVTVFVKDHNSQTVIIEGSVIRAGVYPIRGKLSLVQLIAMAGGVNNDLYSKEVTVFRTINDERTSKVFDIDEIRAGKAADPVLHQGDVVVVDNSTGKVAFQNALKIIPGAASLGAVAVTHVP